MRYRRELLYLEWYLNRRMPPRRGKWTWDDPFHNMIHCMVFPYLKCLMVIKEILHIVLVYLLWYFVFSYLVLNKWYQSTFLGRHCGQTFFIFAKCFLDKQKEGRNILEILGIFMWNFLFLLISLKGYLTRHYVFLLY